MEKKKKTKNKPENYWNHRVVKQTNGKETYYTIREVYYKDGVAWGWSKEARPAFGYELKNGGGVKSLKKNLKQMLRACDLPVMIEKKKGKKDVLVEES